ncbi:MAG: sigma-54 dependent transcriptional regulator [Planctomycetia bacterium]
MIDPNLQPILLEAWRAAGKHAKVDEVLQRLFNRLPDSVGVVAALWVFDLGQTSLNLAAKVASRSAALPLERFLTHQGNSSQLLEPGDLKQIASWRTGDGPPPTALFQMTTVPEETRWVPLVSEHHSRSLGIMALYANGDELIGESANDWVTQLIEPIAVAVESQFCDRQIDTAEAEKQSLLTRLGRKEIADVIIGDRTGLAAVMERVELVARSDAPVLIFGETGTGKEVIARTIHNRSERANGPFHRVNCGAIPPELIDSELFGHEKGAFTGAIERRKGWFERAEQGTLFLDEVGELPLAAQVRLLRILQDGNLERVGGQESTHVDVRIIAATHRDLVNMVSAGRFRDDLWYRIAVFPIFLPPLRDRVGDIPDLAIHFAKKAAVRFGLPPVFPMKKDIRLLQNYSWPGNVRELASVIDRAAILGDGQRLEIAISLGTASSAKTNRVEKPSTQSVSASKDLSAGSFLTLEEATIRHIETALVATRGQIEGEQGAARLLGVNPHTLRSKMRRLGIQWNRFRSEET